MLNTNRSPICGADNEAENYEKSIKILNGYPFEG